MVEILAIEAFPGKSEKNDGGGSGVLVSSTEHLCWAWCWAGCCQGMLEEGPCLPCETVYLGGRELEPGRSAWHEVDLSKLWFIG